MAILPIGAEVSAFVPAISSPIGTSAISGIEGIGSGSGGAGTVAGTSFGEMLTKGVENVQATQDKASDLSGKVATGELKDIHDFTTAAAKANLAVRIRRTSVCDRARAGPRSAEWIS